MGDASHRRARREHGRPLHVRQDAAVQWKPVRSLDPQGKIDLRASLANRDHCVGYAYAEILLERPAEALLLLGVDDSEKVWVNGEKVFELFTSRRTRARPGSRPREAEGRHEYDPAKLYQDTLGWEFCLADRHPRRPSPRVCTAGESRPGVRGSCRAVLYPATIEYFRLRGVPSRHPARQEPRTPFCLKRGQVCSAFRRPFPP